MRVATWRNSGTLGTGSGDLGEPLLSASVPRCDAIPQTLEILELVGFSSGLHPTAALISDQGQQLAL